MEFCMARCSMFSSEPSVSSSAEAESLHTNCSIDPFVNRRFARLPGDRSLSLFPTQSIPFSLEIKRGSDAWLVPGSLVWARIASSPWWPAEIMDEKCLEFTNNESHDGLVLVRLFGSHKYAWIDPVKGLSHFNYCYEERSSNPLKPFQDALQQALHVKEQTSSSQRSDKCDISSSNRTNEECDHQNRGKRKHKPRVHFDEVAVPEKPIRKTRRMRIMRYLGLTPPIGSPFPQPRVRNA